MLHSFDMSGTYTPNDTVSHPRSCEPSAIVLSECQISYRRNILQRIYFASQATALYLVPPLIQFISSSPDVKSSHLESLNTVNNGAAPIGPNDVERLLRKAPNMQFTQGTLCQLLNTMTVL